MAKLQCQSGIVAKSNQTIQIGFIDNCKQFQLLQCCLGHFTGTKSVWVRLPLFSTS